MSRLGRRARPARNQPKRQIQGQMHEFSPDLCWRALERPRLLGELCLSGAVSRPRPGDCSRGLVWGHRPAVVVGDLCLRNPQGGGAAAVGDVLHGVGARQGHQPGRPGELRPRRRPSLGASRGGCSAMSVCRSGRSLGGGGSIKWSRVAGPKSGRAVKARSLASVGASPARPGRPGRLRTPGLGPVGRAVATRSRRLSTADGDGPVLMEKAATEAGRGLRFTGRTKVRVCATRNWRSCTSESNLQLMASSSNAADVNRSKVGLR